jgi:hypothetical protein
MWIGCARSIRLFVVVCCFGLAAAATPGRAIELVTPREAALPADQGISFCRCGTTRDPTVIVVSPAPGAGAVHSPIDLNVKFVAHGGARIDPDSVLLIYKKTPEINITSRIKSYVGADGLEVPDAEVPPGEHQFRIQVKDSNGLARAVDFSIQVAE